jgi:3-hydroxy acid dehydrogenase/malonic semialdehyde reductase
MKKWALITGASSGIGWETSIALAQMGYSILATGRRTEKLKELERFLHEAHPQIDFQGACFDVSDRFEVSQFFNEQSDKIHSIEVLVNNAGLALGVEKMHEASLDDWEIMVDTNIKGLLFMTRGVVEHMVKKNLGHIINLGSVAGRYTYPGGGVYCATKAAVASLTEGLRMDLLGSRVRITNIEPGMVNTEFSVVRLGDQEKAQKIYEGMTPLNAKDIAETIAWCISRPAHVNIQELIIYPTDQAHVGQVARRS